MLATVSDTVGPVQTDVIVTAAVCTRQHFPATVQAGIEQVGQAVTQMVPTAALSAAQLKARRNNEGKVAGADWKHRHSNVNPRAYRPGHARSAAVGVPPPLASLERCTRALHGDRTKAGNRRDRF